MTKIKKGRPQKEKDPLAKQMNVMLSGETQSHPLFKEKVRYMSFSQYVNSLIDNDLKQAPCAQL